MNNTAITTETAEKAAALNLSGYLNGVAAHIGRDWSAHTPVKVHAVAYLDAESDVVATHTVRLTSTYDVAGTPTSGTFALPALVSVESADPQGQAPFIAVQPANTRSTTGSQVQLSVVAVSASLASYQWENITGSEAEEVDGATSSVLVIPVVSISDAGTYRCRVTNLYGTTESTGAKLTVT